MQQVICPLELNFKVLNLNHVSIKFDVKPLARAIGLIMKVGFMFILTGDKTFFNLRDKGKLHVIGGMKFLLAKVPRNEAEFNFNDISQVHKLLDRYGHRILHRMDYLERFIFIF